MHCRGDRSLELGCFQVFCSGSKGFLSQGKYLGVSLSQSCWDWDFTEVLIRHGNRTVDQVAPAISQLIVDAANEFIPGKVSVVVFWACNSDEVTQCIWAEFLEEILDVDNNALGRGEFRARHRQKFRRYDLGGKVQLTVLV